MADEAVVIMFNSRAMGIAARRGRPLQYKSGVYIMAPPRPSREKRTAIKNAMDIICSNSIVSLLFAASISFSSNYPHLHLNILNIPFLDKVAFYFDARTKDHGL